MISEFKIYIEDDKLHTENIIYDKIAANTIECNNCHCMIDELVIDIPPKQESQDGTLSIFCPFCGEKIEVSVANSQILRYPGNIERIYFELSDIEFIYLYSNEILIKSTCNSCVRYKINSRTTEYDIIEIIKYLKTYHKEFAYLAKDDKSAMFIINNENLIDNSFKLLLRGDSVLIPINDDKNMFNLLPYSESWFYIPKDYMEKFLKTALENKIFIYIRDDARVNLFCKWKEYVDEFQKLYPDEYLLYTLESDGILRPDGGDGEC